MKTAAIVYEFPSHTETFVASQIRGLVELGCDMRIFADGADPVAVSHSSGGDELQNRVSYFGLPLKRFRDAAGRLRSAFPSSGGTGAPSAAQSRGSLRLRLEARAFTGMPRFDVVHSHFGPNGVRAVGLREIGAISGPIITSFYGYDTGRSRSRGGYDVLFSSGDQFMALSGHMRSALLAMGCPGDRITVHPLGVDLDRFVPAPRRRNAHFEVISIARLIPKKGLEFGLEAIAELVRRGVRVGYTIVGTGLLRRRLERKAAQSGIAGMVRFAGAQPPAVVIELLQGSDVLLAPSVTAADGDMEGTPVAILEAQACGLPVVATRHAGIPEIVADGESGFLASERNSAELADHLERFAESPPRRATMGIAGRAIVIGSHDIRTLNRRLFAIYETVTR